MAQGIKTKLKLMVVDDEPDNLDLLYRTFRRDFEVLKAESAIEALQMLEQQGEMAIIISDQRMPEMLGTEFLSKTVDRYPDTIRIVLTGYTDVEDLVEAINSGKVFKYITKPWNPVQLKGVVEQAAETYKVLKQRTNELRRALRRESLFNTMTTAIRESLDYDSMLRTTAETLGQTFTASRCILYSVVDDRPLAATVIYQEGSQADSATQPQAPQPLRHPNEDSLIQAALQTRQTQTAPMPSEQGFQLVVPLTYQQEFLAVLSLYRKAIEVEYGPTHPFTMTLPSVYPSPGSTPAAKTLIEQHSEVEPEVAGSPTVGSR